MCCDVERTELTEGCRRRVSDLAEPEREITVAMMKRGAVKRDGNATRMLATDSYISSLVDWSMKMKLACASIVGARSRLALHMRSDATHVPTIRIPWESQM
jgi:hypothetical protein